MKKLVYWQFNIICFVLISGSLAWAQSEVPNLVGAWQVQSEAGVLIRGDKTAADTHHDSEYSKIDAEAVIEKQQGRVIKGYFKTSKHKEEFVGVIGHDNKTFYLSDTDGFTHGKILGPDKMESFYIHAKPTDSVAAAATWTKKK